MFFYCISFSYFYVLNIQITSFFCCLFVVFDVEIFTCVWKKRFRKLENLKTWIYVVDKNTIFFFIFINYESVLLKSIRLMTIFSILT